MGKKKKSQTFPSAQEDARSAELCAESPQTLSSAYRMAYSDHDFLLRDELRPVRLQLELLKPEIIMNEHRIEGTVVVFGGARIPDPETASQQVADAEAALRKDPDDPQLQESLKKEHFLAERSKYYDEARSLARLISQGSKAAEKFNLVVVTGGGPVSWRRPTEASMTRGWKASASTSSFRMNKNPTNTLRPNFVSNFITSPFGRCTS